MKEEKGITLTILIIYIVLIILVIGMLSFVSQYFYSNTSYITDMGKYVGEFNKFNMYFIEDVKNNKNIYSIQTNKLVFEDGTMYTFEENAVYRGDIKICNNIENCIFENTELNDENGFTKQIIKVHFSINGSKRFDTTNEYVLKYW